jgi:hypothetical protein
MNFAPFRPYMVATWVPGKFVAPGVIEFERKRIYFDGKKFPDILVFDKDYNCRYGLDGNPVGSPETEGYLYPWAKNRIVACDALNGRVQVSAEVAADDIIYGFYFYEEPDLIYTALDINPFSNPAVRNKKIEFVYRADPAIHDRAVWHRVYNADGTLNTDLTDTDIEKTASSDHTPGRCQISYSLSIALIRRPR